MLEAICIGMVGSRQYTLESISGEKITVEKGDLINAIEQNRIKVNNVGIVDGEILMGSRYRH